LRVTEEGLAHLLYREKGTRSLFALGRERKKSELNGKREKRTVLKSEVSTTRMVRTARNQHEKDKKGGKSEKARGSGTLLEFRREREWGKGHLKVGTNASMTPRWLAIKKTIGHQPGRKHFQRRRRHHHKKSRGFRNAAVEEENLRPPTPAVPEEKITEKTDTRRDGDIASNFLQAEGVRRKELSKERGGEKTLPSEGVGEEWLLKEGRGGLKVVPY